MKKIILPLTILGIFVLGCDRDSRFGNEDKVNREIDSLQIIYDSLDLLNTKCCDLNVRLKVLDLKSRVSSQKLDAVLRKYEARHEVWSFRQGRRKEKICCD